jgi:membrane fusion protein (multidrug efflux system)
MRILAVLGAVVSALASHALAQELPRVPAPAASDIRAQLVPRRFTTLSAELAAKVEKIHTREMASFREGQKLVDFDCALQRAQLEEANASVFAAERNYSVQKRLFELASGGGLEADLAAAELAKGVAKQSAMKAIVSKCVIVAPFAGRVAEQKMRDQQFAQAGQPILDILDDSSLEVEFLVPSAWLAWLRPGRGAGVRIDETGRSYRMRVVSIAPRVEPISQSVKIIADIDGRFPELIAGMSGTVTVDPPK